MLWRDLFNRAAAAAETDDRLLTADRRFKISKSDWRRAPVIYFHQASVIRRQASGNYSARPGRKTPFPNGGFGLFTRATPYDQRRVVALFSQRPSTPGTIVPLPTLLQSLRRGAAPEGDCKPRVAPAPARALRRFVLASRMALLAAVVSLIAFNITKS
jgi:hypothetical protein